VASTAAQRYGFLLKTCALSQSKGILIEDCLKAQLIASSGLSTKGGIQATSYGGQSASYFAPGQGDSMTGQDEVDIIVWALRTLQCLLPQLEEDLGRPPTPDEICDNLLLAVPPGITELGMSYTMLRCCR
jgi:hypothetical protein